MHSFLRWPSSHIWIINHNHVISRICKQPRIRRRRRWSFTNLQLYWDVPGNILPYFLRHNGSIWYIWRVKDIYRAYWKRISITTEQLRIIYRNYLSTYLLIFRNLLFTRYFYWTDCSIIKFVNSQLKILRLDKFIFRFSNFINLK